MIEKISKKIKWACSFIREVGVHTSCVLFNIVWESTKCSPISAHLIPSAIDKVCVLITADSKGLKVCVLITADSIKI